MPRRQILSSEEQERLLVIPDDEMILTRMCFLNEQDIALINKHRRPANRLGFAVLLCYLRGPGFIPDKSNPPHSGVISRIISRLNLQPDLWPEYASRGHCCKVSDEAAFCLIQRPYISKTLLTRRISPRGSP